MKTVKDEQFSTWSRGLRRSDQQAYTQVFQMTYDALYRYAWYFTHDQDAAYDEASEHYSGGESHSALNAMALVTEPGGACSA